ncbi:DGQHR domain-containing protein [Aestuariivirga sp.]|uniref:DGQHR domain-containing protein n=1 Tax=Aestuariivirga sp. TaxID=2650926 RepID=UPI003594751B
MTAKRLSFPALRLKQNEHTFYFTTIPIEDLFPSCFVARRDEDALAGFQRALNEGRANDIAKYLSSGSGSIPSNIVLSAQGNADFKYNTRSKTISYAAEKLALLVLDGQHRLWGYQKSRVRHRVPAAIYSGLYQSALKVTLGGFTNQL